MSIYIHTYIHKLYLSSDFSVAYIDVLGLFMSRTEGRRPAKFKFSLEKLKS